MILKALIWFELKWKGTDMFASLSLIISFERSNLALSKFTDIFSGGLRGTGHRANPPLTAYGDSGDEHASRSDRLSFVSGSYGKRYTVKV